MKQRKLRSLIFAGMSSAILFATVAPVMAQSPTEQLPPASASATSETSVTTESQQKATSLIGEALQTARNNNSAKTVAVRDAASLLPLLAGDARDDLTSQWLQLANSANVSRQDSLNSYSNFFGVAARQDADYTNGIALQVPDAAARAGGFVQLSRAAQQTDWNQADQYLRLANRAAQQESDPLLRAKALTFIAYRDATLNPVTRRDSVEQASIAVRRLNSPRQRDFLLADLVGAAAKFDISLARQIAKDIDDIDSQGLAQARLNLAEISQTSMRKEDSERVAELARAAAPYDLRAVPYLLQLPPSPEVFKALGDALPPISPKSTPAIDANLLQRIWDYAKDAPQDTYRDQLQSRLARLMTSFDLWRGKSWGDQLAWDGGKNQVARYVRQVTAARQLRLQSEPLRVLAEQNPDEAISRARSMNPKDRTAALLLIAGQILNPAT